MTSASTDRDDPAAYPVAAEFAATANADASLYEQATADREGFWAEQANRLHWHQPFTHTLDWTNPPIARWFH
ncbi:acetyl-coenzyme A synthetase N-terminal domain-containing protein, partial [Nocardia aurea]